MAVTTRLYRGGRLEEVGFDPDQTGEKLRDPECLVWVDVADPRPDDLSMLGAEFGFHPLALEDCLHPHQRPKIEQYETYFFLVAYGATVEGGELVTHETGVFVGHNYLVTVRKPPALDLAEAVRRWEAHSELAREGGGYLLYILLDEIVDRYFDVLDHYDDAAEEIEDRVFRAGAGAEVQGDIFRLRKEMLHLRRTSAPLREVLDVMQRRTVPVVTERLEPYYRDVYDHTLRATEHLDGLRELLSSALDASLAVVSNRLNEVVKSLTSWGAIILVPSLIAGIYGMNFRFMPELSWLLGYPFALALMAGSAFLLYRSFRRRGWL